MPRISLNNATRSSSFTNPMANPATAAFTGTPASMRDSEPAHTVAMEEEPLDSKMSETRRMV